VPLQLSAREALGLAATDLRHAVYTSTTSNPALRCDHGQGGLVRAVVHDRYGSPDVLRIEDVPVPSPAVGQVRVKVAATSLNLSDWEGLTDSPGYARLDGLRVPRHRTLGSDVAGWVDAVGERVTRFRPGDEVYGDNLQLKGGSAEYTVAPESALTLKPPELTFIQASTIPQAGAIALKGTRDAAAGRRMLINGAGGGSGSFAIQLAKQLGADVTGVDNARKLDSMRSLGADEVIDYRADDFTRRGPYDEILDLVAHRSVFAYRRALAAGGRHRCASAAPCAHFCGCSLSGSWPAGLPAAGSACSSCSKGQPTLGRWPPDAQPVKSTSTSTVHSAYRGLRPGEAFSPSSVSPSRRWPVVRRQPLPWPRTSSCHGSVGISAPDIRPMKQWSAPSPGTLAQQEDQRETLDGHRAGSASRLR
jgi:NADPH:quinone reductase-like Zn-dependent oxidoreductase